jgi:hypothetical protein
MPWRCPACSNIIRHDESERTPHPQTRYRCHLCRVGLVYQPTDNKMVVVGSDDDSQQPERKQSGSR